VYVIFGATGQTGSAVADALLEKSQLVRVVLRSDKTAAAWRARGADVASADLSDLEAMTRAMENADAVYAMNPPAYNVADMVAVARDIGERYVAAIKNSGAQKVVLLSSIGSQHASGTGNILTTHILETMHFVLNASTTSIKGTPAFSVYSATKAAVRSFAHNWTLDLKDRQIRVNAVSPGVIPTPSYNSLGLSEEQLNAFPACNFKRFSIRNCAAIGCLSLSRTYCASKIVFLYVLMLQVLIGSATRSQNNLRTGST
jgi:NAD(P)-dependent dehydrogenase (short-subunit alcohol dehydrogenase family)